MKTGKNTNVCKIFKLKKFYIFTILKDKTLKLGLFTNFMMLFPVHLNQILLFLLLGPRGGDSVSSITLQV